MPLFRAIALSALIVCPNADAFVPIKGLATRGPGNASGFRSPSRFSLSMSTQTPPETNFYKVLGVTQSAGDTEIKAAYRKLAKLYHPGTLWHNRTRPMQTSTDQN